MSVIKEITYRVTGSLGDVQPGELRCAYAIASHEDESSVLIFHPKDEDCASGSLEFGVISPEAITKKLKIYQSKVPDSDMYVNLPDAEEKFYRKLVADAGLTIPDRLTLMSAPVRQAHRPLGR